MTEVISSGDGESMRNIDEDTKPQTYARMISPTQLNDQSIFVANRKSSLSNSERNIQSLDIR
jgi:hypothetical protein